jgi:hypothetical protein
MSSTALDEGTAWDCPACGANIANSTLRFCEACGHDRAPDTVDAVLDPANATVAPSGSRGGAKLAIAGIVTAILGGVALLVPLIELPVIGRASIWQARDICSNPFGPLVSECSTVTFGFFAGLIVVAVGLILFGVGMVRRTGSQPARRETTPEVPVRPLAEAAPEPLVAQSVASAVLPAVVRARPAPAIPAGPTAAETAARLSREAAAAGATLARRLGVVARQAGGRFRALDLRVRLAIVAVAAVLIAASFVVTSLNAPEHEIGQIIEGIAARQSPANLLDADEFAASLGVARAPAGIEFNVEAVEVTHDEISDRFDATWRLVATGNGASTLAEITATFTRVEDAFAASTPTGELSLDALVAVVDSDDGLAALMADTVAANSAFGSTVAARTSTVDDPAGVAVEPIRIPDPELLEGPDAPVPGKAGSPARVERTYIVVDGAAYLVRSVPIPAQPATVSYGTLEPETFTAPAADALEAFAAARAAGDVEEASRYLANAEGLTTSGLEASSMPSASASHLRVVGGPGAYHVVLPDGSTMKPGPDGAWQLDYAGQPLQVLAFPQEFQYTAPDEAGSDVLVHLQPVTLLSGSGASAFDLVFDVEHFFGDRSYSDEVRIGALTINGSAIPVSAYMDCPVDGREAETITCSVEALPIPAEGLTSVEVLVGFGPSWTWDQYGTTTFSSQQ